MLGFISPPHYQAYLNKEGTCVRVDPSQKDNATHIILTDFRLRNATFDTEMNTIIDYGEDTQLGFASEF